jgi:hypothetical protein
MAKRKILTADKVRQLLDYSPETGELRWKTRTPDMIEGGIHSAERKCRSFNSRFAGNIAGTVDGTNHIQIRIFGQSEMAHRLAYVIMTGEWPPKDIDHKNIESMENSWKNLRLATRSQNGSNRKAIRNNKLGIKGVYKKKNRFIASIRVDYKLKNLGSFKTVDEASKAYAEAAVEYFGEYARTG